MNIKSFKPKDVAQFIDHTCVKVDATTADIKKTCEEAIKHKFHSVCVTPYRVKDAKRFLGNSDIDIIAVVGFPFGFTTTLAKVVEATQSVTNGATEIDMVVNINAIKDANWDYVLNDIRSVVESVADTGVKVIMEPGYLKEKEFHKACKIAEEAGAAYVKTATGYGVRGAELHDMSVMKSAISEKTKIKASGGIHDFETVIAMLKAGASRIGSSSGLEIIGAKKTPHKKSNSKYNY